MPNKATADVKAAAQKYTIPALQTLAAIMQLSETDAARVAAAKELLDRGHGKSVAITETTITERYVVRAAPKPKDVADWRDRNAPVLHGPH